MESDWVEEHDALYDLTTREQKINHNAEVWFSTNLRIREALKRLQLAMETAISNGSRVPKINFRLLVHESGITNKTLCNKLRKHWINSEIKNLNRIPSRSKKTQTKSVSDLSEKERHKIAETNLHEQFFKEIANGRIKDREIQRLNKIIILLRNKLGGLDPDVGI